MPFYRRSLKCNTCKWSVGGAFVLFNTKDQWFLYYMGTYYVVR